MTNPNKEPYKGEVVPLAPYKGEVVPLTGTEPENDIASGGGTTDAEIEDWKKYGRKGVEHPDMPTIASLPFGELWGADIPKSSSLALMATLATDNVDARKQIALKHLPGAKGGEDRYGNPWVEYKDKKYYMARPGEFDATDAARVGGTVAAAAPAMAIAPVSLPLAAVASGLTAGGMSLGEDALTRLAGGTAQPIDLTKAVISTLFGVALPPFVAKAVLPVAGRLNAVLRSGQQLSDDAIRALGLDPTILTPELRQSISTASHRTFGDRTAAQTAYRQGLGDEFNTAVTRGEASQVPSQLAREKMLSGPGNAEAERIMQEFRTGPRMEGTLAGTGGQEAQRTAAQNRLRGRETGGVPLTPMDAGDVLRRGAASAQTTAQQGVDQLYSVGKNPALLASSGMPPSVPVPYIAELGGSVRAALERTGPGRSVINFPHLTPNASRALQDVEQWAAGQAGPRGLNHPNISWEDINNMRIVLGQHREAAMGQGGTRSDRAAVQQIIEGFDAHFSQLNPMLDRARAANTAMQRRFNPNEPDIDKATTKVLTALQSEEPGVAVIKAVFDPHSVKTGQSLQMIDHLNTQVFPNQPGARAAIREQAIARLTTHPDTGATLTPRQTVTAIDRALDGEAEGPLYHRLFPPEKIAELRRYRDLQRAIADGRESPNPSKSGLLLAGIIQHGSDRAAGAAIGGVLGSLVGQPGGGALAGGAVGSGVSKVMPRIQAQSAVTPPANYLPTGPQGARALPPSLLATPPAADATVDQMRGGPADRLMQGLLGGR